jgi:3-dehydroquinate synthase
MKLIQIRLKERGYDVIVGNNILGTFVEFLKKIDSANNIVIVTNPVIKRIWGKKIITLLSKKGINAKFEEVADTEKSKSIKTCFELINEIADFGKSRKLTIIAFGGGVIGDLAGFVASIYKRGIPYVQLPTTLVAQVDSAIGGKVAIDLKVGKNLVGSFYQPRLVFSETAFLDSLPKRELVNGLAEVIKYAVIKDSSLFEFLENNLAKVLTLDKDSVEYIIATSSQIKSRIVEQDELDKLGVRAILNYGHTIGHAIEAASGYSKRYTHGEAVGIGMIAANFISREFDLISKSAAQKIKNLLEQTGLPTTVEGVSPAKIYEAHHYDKKFTNGKNRFVLAVDIGKVKIVEGIPETAIKKAIDSICSQKR